MFWISDLLEFYYAMEPHAIVTESQEYNRPGYILLPSYNPFVVNGTDSYVSGFAVDHFTGLFKTVFIYLYIYIDGHESKPANSNFSIFFYLINSKVIPFYIMC